MGWTSIIYERAAALLDGLLNDPAVASASGRARTRMEAEDGIAATCDAIEAVARRP